MEDAPFSMGIGDSILSPGKLTSPPLHGFLSVRHPPARVRVLRCMRHVGIPGSLRLNFWQMCVGVGRQVQTCRLPLLPGV